jgi:hypothetical protein
MGKTIGQYARELADRFKMPAASVSPPTPDFSWEHWTFQAISSSGGIYRCRYCGEEFPGRRCAVRDPSSGSCLVLRLHQERCKGEGPAPLA